MALDDRSGSVWAVAIVFTILSWLTVGLRIYVRREHIGRFGLDDKLVIVSQIFFTAYLTCQMGGAYYGTGRHLADLDYANAETALRFWFFCEVWYSLAVTAVKVAICLSLRRVTVNYKHLLIIYGLMVWSVALGLAFFLGIIFQCIPTSDWFSLDPDKKRCLAAKTINALIITVSALNVACDWTLGIFPFFIVKDLTIPLQQKIMVASILAFGAIASTATIVRMFYLYTLDQIYHGWNGDFLYDTTPVAIWTTVEVGIAITATCLSTLRPLVSKIIWFLRSSNYTSYAHGYPSTHLTDDSRSHIQLDESVSGVPGTAGTDGTYNSGDRLTATHFNATKPLGSHRDRHTKHKTSPPPTEILHAHAFNTTKALSSSQSEIEDDEYYHSASSRSRRPPPI